MSSCVRPWQRGHKPTDVGLCDAELCELESDVARGGGRKFGSKSESESEYDVLAGSESKKDRVYGAAAPVAPPGAQKQKWGGATCNVLKPVLNTPGFSACK